MIEKEIDYKALYDRLVTENEELHLALSNLKGASYLKSGIALDEILGHVRDFIQNNYLVLLFLLFAASSVISGLYTLYQDRRRP